MSHIESCLINRSPLELVFKFWKLPEKQVFVVKRRATRHRNRQDPYFPVLRTISVQTSCTRSSHNPRTLLAHRFPRSIQIMDIWYLYGITVWAVCEERVHGVRTLIVCKTWKYGSWRFQRRVARLFTTKTRFCGSLWVLNILNRMYQFLWTREHFLTSTCEPQQLKMFWHH